MRIARARLMDFSFSRRTASPLSIILVPHLHHLTESMTRGSFVAVSPMLPALPTDSWLALQAHRRHNRRGPRRRRSIPDRCALHLTQRLRHGEVQCLRAEDWDFTLPYSRPANLPAQSPGGLSHLRALSQ